MGNIGDMKIVCADQSMRRPGFALQQYKAQDRSVTILRKSHVDNKHSGKLHGQILKEIADEQQSYLSRRRDFSSIVLVRERGFSRFAKETQALYKVIGVTDLCAWTVRGGPFTEIAPKSVKKAVTGNASASKEEVASCLEKYIGKQEYACDDESDAVAVGIAYLIQNGFLDPIQCESPNQETE